MTVKGSPRRPAQTRVQLELWNTWFRVGVVSVEWNGRFLYRFVHLLDAKCSGLLTIHFRYGGKSTHCRWKDQGEEWGTDREIHGGRNQV
jgi:hypothetical protein